MSVARGGQVLFSRTTMDLLHDLPQDFPPIDALNQYPNNFPIQLTSYIGREKEIQEIEGALGSIRLVTLTGSGRTGKTRLAQEVIAHLLTNFQHGVWFVELAPLSSEEHFIPALAQRHRLRSVFCS